MERKRMRSCDAEGGSGQGPASRARRAGALGLSLCLCWGLAGCAAPASQDGQASDAAQAEVRSENSDDQQAAAAAGDYDLEFTKRDKDASYDEASATKIALTGTAASVEGPGASVDGTTVRITDEGTYVVSGSLGDGQLQVDTGDEVKVQVVLAGADVHNDAGPAFYVKNADKVFLTLAEGTSNALSDGTTIATDEDGDELNAALLSKDDLTINGTGALSVQGNAYHAVKSSDDLVITGGTFEVTSVEDAFHGKDCVKVAEGTFTVNAGDDAFHSDLLTYFASGTVDVQSCYEGYEGQAVIIDGGTHQVVAEDDALNAALADSETTDAQAQGGRMQGQMPDGEREAEQPAMPSNGDGQQGGQMPEMAEMPTDGAADAGGKPGMRGGGQPSEMPDGMPADGLDGTRPAMPEDGTDGFAGQDGKLDGQPGGGMAQSSELCLIQINGGELYLQGGNDAIDSNGNVELNGGTVVACGPSSGMDGALDYDLDAAINGGTVLMLGSIGSTRGLDASAQEYRIEQLSGQAGAQVQLQDANGTALAEVTAPIAFQGVLASAPSDGFTVSIG